MNESQLIRISMEPLQDVNTC